jgi:UDP-N-acetylglucosamine--N-acetylmuramyl-(pentapeptide) pyrophosphoryl-undecaprenol N-acetylglucosamine transferase
LEQNNNFKILVAAGGTGGHLYPALAVLEHLEEFSGKKTEASFVGTAHRIESRVIPQLGYEFNIIPISGFKGLFSIETLFLPFKIIRSKNICKSIIRRFKPELVLCTGAYISYPAGLAAYDEKVTLVLMESNVSPGKSLKMLSHKADMIITSFEETAGYFDESLKSRIEFLGNPVRKEICNLPVQKEARTQLGLNTDKKTVLIFGGSLGARAINHEVSLYFRLIESENYQLIWQTGDKFQIPRNIPANVKVMKYIENMAQAYAAADLIVSRAGATSVAEICAAGKPSVLIPLSSASNNEQELNANVLAAKGASIVIKDDKINDYLFNVIYELLSDDEALSAMGRVASTLAKPDAANDSARKIVELVDSLKGKAVSF